MEMLFTSSSEGGLALSSLSKHTSLLWCKSDPRKMAWQVRSTL